MKKCLTVFLLTGFWLLGCAPVAKPPQVIEPLPKVLLFPSHASLPATEKLTLSHFDEVVFSGPVYAAVEGKALENTLTVKGTLESLKSFSAVIRQGVLTIHTQVPVMVSLTSDHAIRQITHQDNGQLFIKNLDEQNLRLVLRGNSITHMTGSLVLSRVDLSNNALLYAYWVNSTHLRVRVKDNARLFLAGIATQLDITASDNAVVDAKYLRVENAYVYTRGNASAGVTVKRALSALSTGKSTIYTYRDSQAGMAYINHQGSVLRMAGIK